MKLTEQEQAIINHVISMILDNIGEDKDGNLSAELEDKDVKKLRKLLHEVV